MEQVEASLRDWNQAPFYSKLEVDANYKRMLEFACRRAVSRETFGKKLSEHQSVLEDIAKSFAEIEQARLLTLQTAKRMDEVGAKDARDLLRIAQESSTGILAADHGGGATKVEVDARHGVLFQLACAAHEGRNVLADELSEDRTAGGILRDRAQDPRLETGIRVDPEILRHVNIRAPEVVHHLHEGEVGHILHGSKDKAGTVVWQKIPHSGRSISKRSAVRQYQSGEAMRPTGVQSAWSRR